MARTVHFEAIPRSAPVAKVERAGPPGRRSKKLDMRSSDVIVVVPDPQMDLNRIRLHRMVEHKGNLNGDSIDVATDIYLDGSSTRHIFVGGNLHETERQKMGQSPVPVRTKDFVDFGRLESAVKALTTEAQRYTPDNPPSEAQLESLLVSYQNILTWREKAAAAFATAEGQIDIAGAMMRKVVSL